MAGGTLGTAVTRGQFTRGPVTAIPSARVGSDCERPEAAADVHDDGGVAGRHPEVGLVTVDCDVLTMHGSDLRIVAWTAAPGSDAAEKLKLLAVISTQVLR